MTSPAAGSSQTPRVIAVLFFFLCLWQGLSYSPAYNRLLVPPPLQVLVALIDLARSGILLRDISATLQRILVGFSLATVVALGVAAMLARRPRLSAYVTPVTEFLRSIPPIAWIPISILWFGIGDKPAYFIVALASFFPVFISALLGLREVDDRAILVARGFKATQLQLITDIYFPLCLPFVVSGMRIGLGIAWMSVITAELVGAQSGLGYMMQLNRMMLQTDYVMAGMLVVGILGLVLNHAMLKLERAVSPWRTSHDF